MRRRGLGTVVSATQLLGARQATFQAVQRIAVFVDGLSMLVGQADDGLPVS